MKSKKAVKEAISIEIDFDKKLEILFSNDETFRQVYYYLVSFEKDFENLERFVLNSKESSLKVYAELEANCSKRVRSAKQIYEDEHLYMHEKILGNVVLNEFELGLTKFIVFKRVQIAVIEQFDDDMPPNYFQIYFDYFKRVNSKIKSPNMNSKYIIETNLKAESGLIDYNILDWKLILNPYFSYNSNDGIKEFNKTGMLISDGVVLHKIVLVFYYLFKEFDLNGVDRTKKVKFIQYVTGRQLTYKKPQNTEIYKILAKPFNLQEKNLREYMKEVRHQFEEIGLTDIALKISKEMNSG